MGKLSLSQPFSTCSQALGVLTKELQHTEEEQQAPHGTAGCWCLHPQPCPAGPWTAPGT